MNITNRILIISDAKAAFDAFHNALSVFTHANESKEKPYPVDCQIDHAESEEEAVLKVKTANEKDHPYTLIVIEIEKSRKEDGVKIASGIRKIDSHVAVLVCAAGKDISRYKEMNKNGCNGHLLFLQKPVNKTILQQLILFLLMNECLKREAEMMNINLKNELSEKTKRVNELLQLIDRAEKEKTQFFINFAHEAKTPLTLIKNYLDKYMAKTGETDHDLNLVKYNIDRFLRDVVNFLDAKKLERGQVFYNHEQMINLTEITEIKSILFKELAYNKQVVFTSSAEPGIFIKADPFAMDRVINNLLDNAVKYTNSGGSIHVQLKKDNKKVMLEVSDTGIGIASDQLQNIFEPYYQISHIKRSLQGIGMGLFITKKIIDEIGGSLKVKSELNIGTTFSIVLEEKMLTMNEQPGTYGTCPVPIKRDHYPRTAIKEENKLPDPDKKNLLLVDDNIEILTLLHSSLKDIYNVFSFSNGKTALENLEKIPVPDIIISDIMMDIMDGHEFFKNISLSREYGHIPFVFLTVKNTTKERIKSLRQGAVDYIYKPFIIEEVIVRIEAILRQKEKYDRQSFETGFLKACRDYGITDREKDVLELLVRGLLYKEISDKLGISIKTVEYHIHNIYKKFSVQNITELMRKLI